MKLLVTSDTHGYLDGFEEAVKKEKPFDILFHCGDVCGDQDEIQRIAGVPCYIIAGNNDFWGDLPKEITLNIKGCKIFMTHGHRYGVDYDVTRLWMKGLEKDAEVVMFGHTHKPVVVENDGVWLINPGSLTYPRTSDRRRSYIVMEIGENSELSFEIKYL